MKRLILISALILLSSIVFGQVSKQSFDLMQEVRQFIEAIKESSIKRGKFNVYVMYFHQNKESNAKCVTLGYIINSYDYQYVIPKYYFKVDTEFVYVRWSDDFTLEDIRKYVDAKEINTDIDIESIQKLFPGDYGGITGASPGQIICWDNGSYDKTFYENSDEIPFEYSIYENFPEGAVVSLVYDGTGELTLSEAEMMKARQDLRYAAFCQCLSDGLPEIAKTINNDYDVFSNEETRPKHNSDAMAKVRAYTDNYVHKQVQGKKHVVRECLEFYQSKELDSLVLSLDKEVN